MRGRADGPGDAVVLIGSSTGRDGIGGASVLASAEFDDDSMSKRPSVQVGDPFTEKLLIEACLELVRRDLLVGLQDLGAGGISCPTSEMCAKSGTGMNLDIDAVHRREPGMEPFEVMISESQERMMAVVEPDSSTRSWTCAAAGSSRPGSWATITEDTRVVARAGGEVVAEVPAPALADEAPMYERPFERPEWIDELQSSDPGDAAPGDLEGRVASRCSAHPRSRRKRWVWEQYDHMIFLGTIVGPGGDAAVIRLPDHDVAVALSVDGPGRFCYLDPYEGARLTVAESARNVACAGARPVRR